MADQSSQRQDQQQQQLQQSGHEQQQKLQQKGQQAVDSFKNFLHEKGPSTTQILVTVTLFPIGAFLLFLAGMALTGSLIGLAVTAPLFVIFSPVITPAVLTIGLAVMGFLTSGAFGITGLSAISWIINFLRSSRVGSGMEHMTRQAFETAGHMGQKVKDVGQDTTDRAQEAGGGI